MSTYTIHKSTAVPSGAQLAPHQIWMVTDQTDAALLSVYVTDAAGTALRHTITKSEVEAMVTAASGSSNYLVSDIAARDAITTMVTTSKVYVQDASADATVDSGAAEYVYDGSAWVKVSEAESMDLTINWADIVGAPSASSAAIDAAIAASHTHANLTQLGKVGEDGDGDPTYDGVNFVMSGGSNW